MVLHFSIEHLPRGLAVQVDWRGRKREEGGRERGSERGREKEGRGIEGEGVSALGN